MMTGPLIYGFSVDAVAAAKVVADFAKTNDKLVIRGGAFAGKALDVNGVKQLASIPSKEVLLAQLLGLMQSPISRTARVLAALAEKRRAKRSQPERRQPDPAELCTNERTFWSKPVQRGPQLQQIEGN
jgi:large subunit ribosomal protein L10